MSFRKSKLKIGYPINNIPIWIDLKKKYEEYGYIFTDLEIIKSVKEIKNDDKKNILKFNKLKELQDHTKSGNSIIAPPRPNNYERHIKLKEWKVNEPSLDVCLATFELYTMFNMAPYRDYEPKKIIEVYYDIKNKYKNISPVPSAPQQPSTRKSVEYPPIEELHLSDC